MQPESRLKPYMFLNEGEKEPQTPQEKRYDHIKKLRKKVARRRKNGKKSRKS